MKWKMKQLLHIIIWVILAMVIGTYASSIAKRNPTPLLAVSANTPIPSIVVTTRPQTYTDPDGWFSIEIPTGWEPLNENSYAGENGFVEIGYLPEHMAYLQNSITICQWMANIESQSIYFIHTVLLENRFGGCSLKPLPDSKVDISQAIIENSFADFPKRFIYIKTDIDHHNEILESFVWLHPMVIEQEALFEQLLMRPEDVSFWEKTTTTNEKLTITEYKLPQEAQNLSPTEEIFINFIPSDVPAQERLLYSYPPDETWEDVNEKIKPYGYEIVLDSTEHRQHQLYKNGELLLENIQNKSRFYSFTTNAGVQIALILDVWKIGDRGPTDINGFLLQDKTVTEWGSMYNDPPFAPVFYNNELLWVRSANGNSYVQIQNNNREVIFSFATFYGTQLPVNLFREWNGHWFLEISRFLIEDGEILNEKFGFEEVFDWGLLGNKPFYFFRKGPRIGLSYDGQFFSTYYDYVVNGYCCALGLNNPTWGENNVRFFAKKDGVWYYVITEVK